MSADPPPSAATQDERDLLPLPVAHRPPHAAQNPRVRAATNACGTSSSAASSRSTCSKTSPARPTRFAACRRAAPGRTFSSTCSTTSGRCCTSRSRRPARSSSFMAACQILGITCNEVRDPSTSSETKGETRFDSIRMFSQLLRPDHHAEPRRPAGRGVRVPDERPVGARQPQRADRQRRLRRRPASDAGAARHLHAAAHLSVRQPEGLARRQPVRRNPPPVPAARPRPGEQDLRLLRRHRPRPHGALARRAARRLPGRDAGVRLAAAPDAVAARRPARSGLPPAACGSSRSIRSRSRSTAAR